MLSGNSGASASGLNIQACTASLNLDTCFRTPSAESLSTTLQPVSSASAPMLAPPEMKRRRVKSGMAFAASRTSSCLATPGSRSLRMRPMMTSSTSDDHGAQAFGPQQRQHDMHDQKQHDRRHAEEMDIARPVIAAEQGHQPVQLHRLPDRQARQHD